MLQAPSSRRERILVAGGPGSGKSSCWVSIAAWIKKTKSDAKVRLLDTDLAYDAYRSDYIEDVVEAYSADMENSDEWPQVLQKFKADSRPDDWIVVDMADKLWEAARGYFWRTVSDGTSLGEIYMKAMQGDLDMGGPYGRNWDVMKKIYQDSMSPFLSARCHKLALTPAQEVFTDKSGAALNVKDAEYVRFKYKPAGESRLPHLFHSVLLAQRIPSQKVEGTWTLTTIKEQGPIGLPKRQDLHGEAVTAAAGFVGAYLVKVAGWKL